MHHEVDNAAAVEGAEFTGTHAEIALVVGEELAGQTEVEGEEARADEGGGRDEQQDATERAVGGAHGDSSSDCVALWGTATSACGLTAGALDIANYADRNELRMWVT